MTKHAAGKSLQREIKKRPATAKPRAFCLAHEVWKWEADMFNLTKISVATAICTAVAVSALSVESRAGVMRITDKSSVSLASMMDQVHWRRHCHRHLGSWRNGWTHRGFRCPSNVYGYSAPSVDYYPAPSVDDYSVLSVYGCSPPP